MGNKVELSTYNRILKRAFDIIASAIGLVFFGWLILVSYIIAALDTKQSGFFRQVRVGQHGKLFKVVKIRTMKNVLNASKTTVTTSHDPRITKWGRFWRKTKIDELPQLYNVLVGHMSFVGPRPDVPGYADLLTGEDRMVLSIKPGITGPATLHFRNEEELLAEQNDPELYNRTVIYPMKVELNKRYIREYSLFKDILYIWQTIT